MQIGKSKTAAVITIVLMIASFPLLSIPELVNAQEGAHGIVGGIGTSPSDVPGYPIFGASPPSGVTPAFSYDTYAYMSITPNPIGVGQLALVNLWTCPGTVNWFYRYGYTVTFEKPDGTTEVIGPFNSFVADCTAWFQYVPDQVGTWKAKFDFPGTYHPAGQYVARPGFPDLYPKIPLYASIYYRPSSTKWQEFTVQPDMVMSWPSVPLPSDYWRRPISSENREWYVISGNYPWNGAYYYPGGRVLYASNYKYTQYVQAPNTAHVVWRRQGADGGLIGGDTYQYTRYTGSGNPNIIYAGRCYQTVTKMISGVPTSVLECYDLRTGQVYWDRVGVPAPSAILYEPPAESTVLGAEFSGAYSVYLVGISGGRLLKYDPFSGSTSANVSLPSGITSGTIYNDQWVYTVQTINATANNYRLINWSMQGTDTNFTNRIASNITWPRSVLGFVDYNAGIALEAGWVKQQPDGYSSFSDRGASSFCIGYDINSTDLRTGVMNYHVFLNETYDDPVSSSTYVADRGKVAMGSENLHWTCWDARTGKLLWHSEQTGYPWGNWWAYDTASYDFNESKGAIIASAYDGIYAIDWDDGKILWHYSSSMPPFESPYVGEPFFTGIKSADGKIYAYGGEHTTTQPVTRGWHLHCINATTGEGIWKITGPMTVGAMADGYLTASNPYDGYMYVFGKGKSSTTVSASPKTVAKGAIVLVEGTVMDTSPGDQGSINNPTARLDSPTASGTVPCVSAASMQTQMEYLYMQHPLDGLYHNETITGVPVILTAIGSDGTVIDIGTTTTNGYGGTFGMAWTPPKEDTYTIMATFAGDDSYGSSTATTAMTVGPASTTPTTPEIPTPVDYTPWFYGIMAAVIVAIVIGLAALIGVFRKK